MIRRRVDSDPGFPDRITMQDLKIGDTALLLNYEHLPVASPYRSAHAIFVKEGAEVAYDAEGVVPKVMTRRILSLRGMDGAGHIVDADLAEGAGIAALIQRLLDHPAITYIHAHNAKRGCYAGLITRA